jgi:hypothetical protein
MHMHAEVSCGRRRRVQAVSCACGGSRQAASCACGGSRQVASHVHAQPLARFSRERSTSKRRCILPQQPYLLCLYKGTRTHAHKEGKNTLKRRQAVVAMQEYTARLPHEPTASSWSRGAAYANPLKEEAPRRNIVKTMVPVVEKGISFPASILQGERSSALL